jgi:hypothetical protein
MAFIRGSAVTFSSLVYACLFRPTPRAADGGYVPRFLSFSRLWAFPVSTASLPSHPKQVTPAVGRFS